MNYSVKKFNIIVPAEIIKSGDEWIVQGLASSPSKDQQGEIILPDGIDASPIDQGRGILNWDHQKGPENIVGLLDGYKRTDHGFFVKGRLFKNHQKAKAIHDIMSSLGKSDKGRMGLSVEGKILQRSGEDGKLIRKCQISAVALTMNPVNQDSYVDLVKSMSTSEEVDFQATEENLKESQQSEQNSEPMFTVNQVIQLLQKALGGGGEAVANTAPAQRTQGAALAQEELDKKPKQIMPGSKKKKMKKMSKELYKSTMLQLLDKIQHLYPNNTRTELWVAMKDRLYTKYPELSENEI